MPEPHTDHTPCRCGGLSIQLSAYLDGELPADLCRQIESHLSNCPDCQVIFDTLGRTVQIVRSLGDAPQLLPADVEARLLARLMRDNPQG
ncbi:MAG: hypothetical protein HGA65_04200 [Oscillochloris sp.]|nr:hypothetical protein [Oscillochloris sp.]